MNKDQWYFDHENSSIYLKEDPRHKKVELSVVRNAFSNSDAVGVAIEKLIVEKYAPPAQAAAVGDKNPGPGWKVTQNEIRLNHGTGLRFAGNAYIAYNYIHHNGQLGLGANGGESAIVEFNEICFNNYAFHKSGWEAGGSKFTRSENLIVRNNYVHHNQGPGLWTDIDNRNVVYDGNTVEFNSKEGIFHEISFDALITCNMVRFNGLGHYTGPYGAQILISTSSQVQVSNNLVEVDASGGNGITILHSERGDPAKGWYSRDNLITGNQIIYHGKEGYSGFWNDTNDKNYHKKAQNLFEKNSYYFKNEIGHRWLGENGSVTGRRKSFTEFKAYGFGRGSHVHQSLNQAPDRSDCPTP